MTASDIFFYEAFAEEAEQLLFYANGTGLRVGHSPLTIQETGHTAPPAPVISLRTQSVLPPAWAPQLRGILSRSTGYDHLNAYRASPPPPAPHSAISPSIAPAPSPNKPCSSRWLCCVACRSNSPRLSAFNATTSPDGK